MLFLYHKDAGSATLSLEGEAHRYLFKVRRHRANETLFLRNLQDDMLYEYEIATIDKRNAVLLLRSSEEKRVCAFESLHIGWCVIDPKSIEKALPILNETGVEKITFIYCDRSQKSFKLDFERFEKILRNSSQQCGRSRLMRLAKAESLAAFVSENPDAVMVNFSQNGFSSLKSVGTVVIGCEGGFTDKERALFKPESIVGFSTPLVLKSESAACAVAAKVLL